MDSERRHELETNDLREFMENFKDFWDKYGNQLLLGLIIVLGGWLGYSRYNQWQADKADAAYTSLNDADSPDAFRAIAGEHSRVFDEAMRRGGDTALGQARRDLIANDTEAANAVLKKAAAAYTALVERGGTVEYQLAGQEGLAKVAVMRDEWDKAEAHYQRVIELADDTYVTQADRAQRALNRLGLLKSPVAFAEPDAAPEPLPTDVSPGDQVVPDDGQFELPTLPVPPADNE